MLTSLSGMTGIFVSLVAVNSTAENQDLRMVLLRDCAEIFFGVSAVFAPSRKSVDASS